MPFLIEHITEVVFAIVLVIVFGTAALVALAIARRQRREKYFQRIDEMRQRFSPVISEIINQKTEFEKGFDALNKGITGLDRVYILEQLLLEKPPRPAQIPLLRRLCEDLGLVEIWQRRLAGKFDVGTLHDALSRPEGIVQRIGRLGFLVRATSAEYLRIVQHKASWPLLVTALNDRHPDVQSVAARALAAIEEPKSFPALVERFHKMILRPTGKMSLRTIKSALVCFPLNQCSALLPSLTHTHPRIRFLSVDIIREMVERKESQDEDFILDSRLFPTVMADLFLTKLCFDNNADVRARSARIIANLADGRATPVLLTLLEDSEWFVRLHTVRALAKRKFLPQADRVAAHLTDSHWMVREASAKTLLVFGRVGINQLEEHFLQTQDGYSREQIADEMQRTGFIPSLLAQYGVESESRDARVLKLLATMGKTSYLVAVLRGHSDLNLRKKFLAEFGLNPDRQIRSWVRLVAIQESDAELKEMALALTRTMPK